MALIFTDEQTKTITKDIIGLPAVITSLENDKSDQELVETNLEETDSQNKVFTDNYIGILDQYYLEKLEINGVIHTSYNEQFMLDAPLKLNDHFQTDPIWVNYPPQVLPENNGDPENSNSVTEITEIVTSQNAISELKNGYNDGALDDLSSIIAAGGQVEVDVGGFLIGDRIIIDNAGNDLIGLVTDNTGTPVTGAELLDYTILEGSETGLSVGSRVRNFHPGFSNAERENTSTPDAPNAMQFFKDNVDTEIASLELFILPQQTALTANDATGAEATEIAAALVNVNDALSDISTWESAPDGGAGVGRFGDTVFTPLEARLVTRGTQAPARIVEIDAALGVVTQAPGDGAFSGNGNFKRLFDFVDIRINLAGGSLQRLLRTGENITFFEQQINGAQAQLTEYGNIYLVKTLTVDGDGSEFVTLSDVTGLAIGNTVLLMDNDSIVITRNIDDIQGNTIELDSALGVNLLVDKLARLAKEL
ncbi:MAG: hypothetical protein V3T43_02915 [Nitrosomonadaceae bacterium]